MQITDLIYNFLMLHFPIKVKAAEAYRLQKGSLAPPRFILTHNALHRGETAEKLTVRFALNGSSHL